jgi:hypothetical protein
MPYEQFMQREARAARAAALNAAAEPLAVVVDLDQRALAVWAGFSVNHPGSGSSRRLRFLNHK